MGSGGPLEINRMQGGSMQVGMPRANKKDNILYDNLVQQQGY